MRQPSQQRPNRFTTAYRQMHADCPEALQAYAQCVLRIQNGDASGAGAAAILERDSCAAEFAAVKECFRTARRRQRQQKP